MIRLWPSCHTTTQNIAQNNCLSHISVNFHGKWRAIFHDIWRIETGGQLAPAREAGWWMRVDGEGSGVTAEKPASRLRFSPEFAYKVADVIAPGTTVIVTDAPAVRKPVVDSTYFASN
jgi:hypothetical protein